jgi:hemerythrin-like domain-containing protein
LVQAAGAEDTLMRLKSAGQVTSVLQPELQLSLKLAHSEMQDLCEMLEGIADSLPHNLNAGTCSKAAATLEPLVKRVHVFEEQEVFPKYAAANPGPSTTEMLARLREEHCVDECYAEELSDALRRVSSASDPISPDTLGYMLRGFFEAMRRHLAFEDAQFVGYDHR